MNKKGWVLIVVTRVKWDTSKVHPSIKATKNLPQTVRINIFQNSGKQMHAGIQGAYVQKKKLDFWEEQLILWHFNLIYSHSLLSSSVVALKNDSPLSQKNTTIWKLWKRADQGQRSFKTSFPKNCHYLTCLVFPRNFHLQSFSYLTWLQVHSLWKAFY